jgi:hypothetical protein
MSPIRLNGTTSGYTELSAPATAGSNTLTLPTGNGTNGQYLQTNGSGVLSWATLPSSGKILQVVQTVKTDTFSTTTSGSNNFVSITGLSASITPASTSNKVLIFVELGGAGFTTATTLCAFMVQKNSSDISGMAPSRTNFFAGTVGNMRAPTDNNGAFRVNMTYLDSPSSTSSLTYQVLGQAESNGFYINRTENNTASAAYSSTMISSITLVEVAA